MIEKFPMLKAPTLAAALSAELESQAGTRTLARGAAYFRAGAVMHLEEQGDALGARVHGNDLYLVEFKIDAASELTFQCSCPVGQNRIFCKHAVAAALAWLAGSDETSWPDNTLVSAPSRNNAWRTDDDVLREYVASLDRDALQALLLNAASHDRGLRDTLLFSAQAAQASDLRSMKAAVRKATRVSGTLRWGEAGAYRDGLLSLADALRQMLAGPQAVQVVELSELAISQVEKSLQRIDDSGGEVMPVIRDFAAIHLQACKLTRPDPIKLAERLFRLQTEGAWGTFSNVLPAYAAPLAERGLQHYRQQVARAWEALPALPPAAPSSFDLRRMALEDAMLALAEHEGDVDALIRVLSKDLSSPYRFLQVAQCCMQHQRPDDALLWAERGLRESDDSLDLRLLDFCIDAHLRRKDFDQANAHAWRRFEKRPTAESYAALIDVAAASATQNLVRTRAIEHLWILINKEESAAAQKRHAWQTPTRTELVKILLAEGSIDMAWEAFNGGPVSVRIWPDVAEARGKTHPDDGVALYHRLLPAAAQNGTYQARYDEAFEIVRAIRKLRQAQGAPSTFAKELAEIRATYRAKRNFIKLLATLS